MDQNLGGNIERPLPEADIAKVMEKAAEHAASPEGKEMKGEDLIRRSIASVTGAAVVPTPMSEKDNLADNPLTDYALTAPKEIKEKIEELLQVAASNGMVEATEKAKKASPFVLDAFHDALTAKLYPFLKDKGLVK